MPDIIPVAPTAPYDIVETFLTFARIRLNDAIASIGGDVLTDNAAFTQPTVNAAYRRFQAFLDNLGYSKVRKEVILSNLPVVTNLDPASKYWVSWTQLFDGNNYYIDNVLPHDMMFPVRLWERPAGKLCSFWPMEIYLDGLPDLAKQFRNFIWEWRDDTIWMPGSRAAMDLRILYKAYKPDFVTIGATQWYQQPVPFMRSTEGLSNYICSEVASARGDLDAASFDAKAEIGCKQMMNRDVIQKQRKNVRRKARSNGSGHGTNDWI
jgi:hypothetical protein